MLARRLNFRLPEKSRAPGVESLRKELGLNLGPSRCGWPLLEDRILGLNNLGQPADKTLPAWRSTPAGSPAAPPEAAADVEIRKPIAMHVRRSVSTSASAASGTFLWLQDTLAQWGGDVRKT